MELWEGIHLANSTEGERRKAKSLLQQGRELPFVRDWETVAGEISVSLYRDGDSDRERRR
ncbi:hypothetical protein [Natrinema halophilum]|nr:hypothetical protein [Natrinema halophilum]QLG47426.2 hypothetical protein HYG82_00475 [Natrinema halophilum]